MKPILSLSFLLLPFLGAAQVDKVAGNFSHATECMGVEGDG